MSFFENTRKPEGFGGKLMVAMMNVGHSAVARWGLQFLNAAPDARVLDCGAGRRVANGGRHRLPLVRYRAVYDRSADCRGDGGSVYRLANA